ncbi:hypothetical protein MY3296_010156 [Beauveria thailandica]
MQKVSCAIAVGKEDLDAFYSLVAGAFARQDEVELQELFEDTICGSSVLDFGLFNLAYGSEQLDQVVVASRLWSSAEAASTTEAASESSSASKSIVRSAVPEYDSRKQAFMIFVTTALWNLIKASGGPDEAERKASPAGNDSGSDEAGDEAGHDLGHDFGDDFGWLEAGLDGEDDDNSDDESWMAKTNLQSTSLLIQSHRLQQRDWAVDTRSTELNDLEASMGTRATELNNHAGKDGHDVRVAVAHTAPQDGEARPVEQVLEIAADAGVNGDPAHGDGSPHLVLIPPPLALL